MRNSAFRIPHSSIGSWLPDMDLNHDKQIQSLLCYRYTIGQAGALDRLNALPRESRFVAAPGATPPAGIAVKPFNGSTT